jgi:hypothetical protein
MVDEETHGTRIVPDEHVRISVVVDIAERSTATHL